MRPRNCCPRLIGALAQSLCQRSLTKTKTRSGYRTPCSRKSLSRFGGGLTSHFAKNRAAPDSTSGGNQTPNRRFWRPVLYQLKLRSYLSASMIQRTHPLVKSYFLPRVSLVRRVLALAATVLLELEAVRSPGFFLNPIVAVSAPRCIPARHIPASACSCPAPHVGDFFRFRPVARPLDGGRSPARPSGVDWLTK